MAAITLTIKDETAGGKIINEIEVSFANELTTVKDIIQARVISEVEAYNKRMPEYFKGLIEPIEAEKTLNGYKIKEKRKVNPEQQCKVALDAFGKNGYFLLIDSIQAESLEQMVIVNKNTKISFIKLTPLVGG
jgi:hypothetical protein